MYNLRHTFASQMISRGADIVLVSNMLISITLSTYTEFIKEDDEVRVRNVEKNGHDYGRFL